MSIFEIILLIGSGLLVGFINVLAGGGSVISLSVLMFLGLPVNVANGTNRIGILFQNLVAVKNFSDKKYLDWKKGKWLAIPAIVGAIVGAQIASNLNETLLERIIGALLVVIMLIMILKPERFIKERIDLINRKPNFWQILIFFGIGLYGGFIQLGVGFFLLAGLVLNAGYELVKANALKVLINLGFTPLSLLIFILNDEVHYLYGLILAVGSMAGAYIASKIAIEWGAKFIRWMVLAVIVLTIVKLFGWIEINM